MRRIVSSAAAVAAAAALAACGAGQEADSGSDGSQAGAAGAPDVVTIGSIHPLTGALAQDGKLLDNAAKLAVEDINAAGGIASMDGAKLELKSGDSQGEPDVGQQEAQSMIQDGAAVLIGPYTSTVATSIASVAARSRVPFVIDVAAADAILQSGPPNEYTFRIQPRTSQFGIDAVRYMKELGEANGAPVRSVAYMHENGEFGTAAFDAFKAEASKAGIEIVAKIAYDAFKQTDYTTDLQRVKASGADVLAVSGYLGDGIAIAKEAAVIKPDLMAVFGVADGAFDLPQFDKAVGKDGEGYLNTTYWPNGDNPEVGEIQTRFEERYGEPMTTAALLSYQAIVVIAQALEDGGSAEPQQLRDAIAEVRVEEPLLSFGGPIEFDERGENVNARGVVVQMQDGVAQQVAPEDGKEADPVFPTTPWSNGG